MGAPLTTRIPIKDSRGNTIDEKEVATYAGLLARGHEEGLKAIATSLIQVPTEANGHTAIATAVVETSKGKFMGIGDASPENVNRKIAPHIIRMAETRAKARALRDAVNIGIVCLEELGGAEGDQDGLTESDAFPRGNTRESNVRELPPRRETPPPRRDDRRPEANGRRDQGQGQGNRGGGSSDRPDRMSESQRRYLYRLLADRGVEGQEANDAICEAAGVERVADVPKNVASRIIDAWKSEAESGAA